jgi:hypothetical protein
MRLLPSIPYLSLSILGIGNQDDPKTSSGGGCEFPSFGVTMEGNKVNNPALSNRQLGQPIALNRSHFSYYGDRAIIETEKQA